MSDAQPEVAIVPGRDGIGFFVHVTPGARTDAVGPAHGDALRVRTSAPPSGGQANAACRAALAEALGVPRSAVELDPGSRGRRKRVFVRGDPLDLAARVRTLARRTGFG